jgi:Peptidase A4 family
MRTTLTTLMAGTAAALAAGLALPTAAAQAATATAQAATAAAKVPAPQKNTFYAGYQQLGCQHNAYPEYIEISGTIVVPTVKNPSGTPGISSDVYDLGGSEGVLGGVSVNNANDQAYYTAFAQWGDGAPVSAPFAVNPGDQLEVTIENEGSSGYMVEIEDGGQEWTEWNPDTDASPCAVGAFVEPNQTYDHVTQTTPVAFDYTTLWWGEQGQGVASVSKLLATPPKYAKLYRYTLVNSSSGQKMAVTSKPIDKYNFTVTDAG